MSVLQRRHDSYVDTGYEYIGRIPDHWSVARLKFLTKCLDGQRIPLNAGERGEMQGDIPYWGSNNVMDHVSDYLFDEELVLLGEDGAPFFESHRDVAFAVNGKIWPNNHVHVLRPNGRVADTQFLAFSLNCVPYHLHITGSTRDKLNQSDMNEILVRCPPLPEQKQIAAFLDYETAKIDALIEKQQQLIALLGEKRQAVISHAVTKGLNPDAPMRDSGVEWLGEVPEHWSVVPLMHLTPTSRQIMYGIILPGPNVDDGVPIVKGGDVKPGRLDPKRLCKTTVEIESRYVRSRIRGGDIVYSIRGSIGDAELVPEALTNANVTQDAARITPLPSVHAEWLLYSMRSNGVFCQLDQRATGATIRGINIGSLKRARIPVPPYDEQIEIAKFISDRIEKIDSLTSKAICKVELLQERRTALISAAVTGKIDVRGWMPPSSNVEPATESEVA